MNTYIHVFLREYEHIPRRTIDLPDILMYFSTAAATAAIASVVSDSMRHHRRQPTRLPRPWDSPGKNTGVGCHFLLQSIKVKSESDVAQSCPTLSNPMDCSPPGFSVHGIFQSRVLEGVPLLSGSVQLYFIMTAIYVYLIFIYTDNLDCLF